MSISSLTRARSSAARRRKVPPPTARDFDPGAWSADYDAHHTDDRDERLHAAGLWLGEALARCWKALEPFSLDTLPLDPVTRYLAGLANEVHLLTEAKLVEAAVKLAPDTLPSGSLAHVKLRIGEGIATADMVRTSVIDTLGKLAQLVRTQVATGNGGGRFDPTTFVKSVPIFEDIYLLEFFWGRMLWQDWSLEQTASGIRFLAGVHDALEASVTVSNWRREQLGAEFDIVYGREWSEPDSVLPGTWQVTARKYAQGYRFHAERRLPGTGRISTVYLMRERLSDTELAAYLDTPLPRLQGSLTLDDLLSAWELLALAARAIEGKLFELGPNPPTSRLGPAIRLEDLDALLSVLGWPLGKRASALSFFTFEQRSQDGLWSRPLLPIGRSRIVPVLTPLIVPNLYRTAELWVSEGAGDDIFRDRGTSFEVRLRGDIIKGLAERPWRNRAEVLREKWEPRIDRTGRDIDLLLRIDNVVFVGELKLKKFPASAAEIGRHAQEFVHAADQLDIRLPWLESHKVEVARRTGFTGQPEALQFFGLIITGTQFGCGCVAGGYPVIDRDSLTFFFEWDEFIVSAEVDRLSGYGPRARKPGRAIGMVEEDVAASFLAYVREPWPARYSELGLVREDRGAKLKLVGQKLCWPDHHLDGNVFAEQAVDGLIERFRAQTERWREEARRLIADVARSTNHAAAGS